MDKDIIIAGNSIYKRCPDCGKLVKLNKFILGDFHFCLTEDEKKEKSNIIDIEYDKIKDRYYRVNG